jgi:hypothetical protein
MTGGPMQARIAISSMILLTMNANNYHLVE